MIQCSTWEFLNSYYESGLPEVLPEEEKVSLIIDAQNGNIDSRNRLVESMYRFISIIAVKQNRPGTELDDLFQVGVLGSIKAINKFNVNAGFKFSTFASTVITNDIRMYIRSLKILNNIKSLEEPIAINKSGDEVYLIDLLEDLSLQSNPAEYIETILMEDLILHEVEKLSNQDRFIIEHRFGLNNKEKHTHQWIGDQLGYSRQYIQRLTSIILSTMRKNIEFGLH